MEQPEGRGARWRQGALALEGPSDRHKPDRQGVRAVATLIRSSQGTNAPSQQRGSGGCTLRLSALICGTIADMYAVEPWPGSSCTKKHSSLSITSSMAVALLHGGQHVLWRVKHKKLDAAAFTVTSPRSSPIVSSASVVSACAKHSMNTSACKQRAASVPLLKESVT